MHDSPGHRTTDSSSLAVITGWDTTQVGDRVEIFDKTGVLSETFAGVVPRMFQRYKVRLG